MKKLIVLLLPLMLATLIAACGGGGTNSSVSSNVRSILAIGDSIGNGFGGTNPWPRLVQEQTGIPVTNDSRNGRQARGSVSLVRQGIANVNPSHVIIMLGTNDANNGSVGAAVNAMRQIIQETQAAGVQIIVATLPPIPRIPASSERARQLSAAYRSLGIPIAEVEGAFGNNNALFLSDRFHPNNDGQQLIANAFINTL